MDRELNNETIGYIIQTDESLREKEESKVRGQEGVSLGMYSACTSQVSRMRVACTSQLYNYMLRFYLTPTTVTDNIEGNINTLYNSRNTTKKQLEFY